MEGDHIRSFDCLTSYWFGGHPRSAGLGDEILDAMWSDVIKAAAAVVVVVVVVVLLVVPFMVVWTALCLFGMMIWDSGSNDGDGDER
eukprot:14146739-Ditylum_brightwellii.AAC.1